MQTGILATSLLALSLAGILATGAGGQVLPNEAVVEGKTIGEWSAEWWKWVFSAPTHENPQLDTDGRWAQVGQPDSAVFFLGGSAGLSPDTIVRSFTVPEGKHLLVPLLVAQIDNIDVDPPLPIEEMRDLLRDFVNDPRELHAAIDGVAVPNLAQHRAASPVFSFEFLDADNFKSFGQSHPVVGFIEPILSDGYWLMLEPLPPGPHVLRYGGTWRLPFFHPNDVIAHVTVVSVPLEQKVQALVAQLEGAGLPERLTRQLDTHLLHAGAALEKEHLRPAIQHLGQFRKEVRHRLSRVDPALTGELIQTTQALIDQAEDQLRTNKVGTMTK